MMKLYIRRKSHIDKLWFVWKGLFTLLEKETCYIVQLWIGYYLMEMAGNQPSFHLIELETGEMGDGIQDETQIFPSFGIET